MRDGESIFLKLTTFRVLLRGIRSRLGRARFNAESNACKQRFMRPRVGLACHPSEFPHLKQKTETQGQRDPKEFMICPPVPRSVRGRYVSKETKLEALEKVFWNPVPNERSVRLRLRT